MKLTRMEIKNKYGKWVGAGQELSYEMKEELELYAPVLDRGVQVKFWFTEKGTEQFIDGLKEIAERFDMEYRLIEKEYDADMIHFEDEIQVAENL